jgi:hypothetical protein
MMVSINVLSLAPAVTDWLANTRHPRILHVFDRACNLINEQKEVLSIVTPRIGNGPFNLVLEGDVCFSDHLDLKSQVSLSSTQVTLGTVTIHIADAKLWNPCPNWEILHARKDDITNQLTKLPITNCQVCGLDMPFMRTAQGDSTIDLQSLTSNLSLALAIIDILLALKITSRLAGLGAGLTPSGDDFIMGAIYAAWIIHPPEVASVLAQDIANTAAPLTTSLSAAWLRSASRGEAGILWHELFEALVSADSTHVQEAIGNILAVGETSGADALAGFISLFMSWIEEVGSSHG